MAATMNARTEQRHLALLMLSMIIGGAAVLSLGGLMRAMFLPSDVAAAVRQEMAAANGGLAAPEMFGTGQMLNGGRSRPTGNNYRPGGVPDSGAAPAGNAPPSSDPRTGTGDDGTAQEFALGSPSVFGPAGTGGGATGGGNGAGGGTPLPGGNLGVEPNPTGSDTSVNPGGGGVTPTEPLPEPETWAMMAAGLVVAGWFARRRRRHAAV